MKNISKSVVRNDGIRLPYWENASRITEFRITFLYTARKYILFIPFLTLLYFIVKGFILYQKYKGRMKQNVTGFFEKNALIPIPARKAPTSAQIIKPIMLSSTPFLF